MNENGEGPLDYIAVLGGLALLAIAGASFFAPVMETRLLEAQAARDIARANATMAQGLADVARINAMTPMLVVFLIALCIVVVGAVALIWARIAWRHLQLREREQWLAQPDAPQCSVTHAQRPAAVTREMWEPVVLAPRERVRLEARGEEQR